MSPPKVNTTLMLHLPPKIAEVSRKTIEKLGHRALVIRRPEEAISVIRKQPIELFLFRIEDPKKDCALFQKIRATQPDCKGIAFLSPRLKSEFPLFRAHTYPDHLIPDKTPMEYSDLAVTLQKAISRDIFGMEKYGIPAEERLTLTSSLQKPALLQKIQDYFRQRGVPERTIQKAALILDEMIMNAIFDAPADRRGHPLYYDRDRSSVILLKPRERPEISYGMADGKLALSVTDHFGRFNKTTFFSIMNRLRRHKSIRRGPGKGAGMGLFMTFRALDEMVVNVAPEKLTEFIGLIYLHKRDWDHRRHRRALHFFQLENARK